MELFFLDQMYWAQERNWIWHHHKDGQAPLTEDALLIAVWIILEGLKIEAVIYSHSM